MNNSLILNVPTSNSPAEKWISWHKAMKSALGKKTANAYFITFWNERAGAGSDASTTDLREYMDKQGVKLDTTALEDAADTLSDVTGFIGGTFSTIKYIGIGVGVIVFGIIAYAAFNVAEDPIKAAGTAASLKSGGLK